MTVPATPPVTTAAKITGLHAALDSAGGDADQAWANVKSFVTEVENSSEVNAVKSFVGEVLKSGRGGACLAFLGAAAVEFFLHSWFYVAMAGAVAALILTSSGAKGLATGETKGVKGWEIMLGLVVAMAAGGGIMWALNNGALAIVSKVL